MSRTIKVRPVRHRKKIYAKLAQERLTTAVYADPAKMAFMSYAKQLTREGLAQWAALGNGIIEFTLISGEVFHLDEISVTRVG
jgi:hypothetical protein